MSGMNALPAPLQLLLAENAESIAAMRAARDSIRRSLLAHADDKLLKGDELVGWMGEVYGKLMLDGRLVDDKYEHDFEVAKDDMRVSVKARKGNASGWTQTSDISRVSGDGVPTHLLFVHLDDDFGLLQMWLYPWQEILIAGRFKLKEVRGEMRAHVFYVAASKDRRYLIYERGA